MSKTTDVLEEKIYQLERDLQTTSNELSLLKDFQQYGWTRHRKISEEENLDLPIPRLELRYTNVDSYNCVCKYAMIYRHLLDDIVCIPLGKTDVGGNGGEPCIFDGKLSLPFRDGAHIKNEMRQLNLPGYVIYNNRIEEIEIDND